MTGEGQGKPCPYKLHARCCSRHRNRRRRISTRGPRRRTPQGLAPATPDAFAPSGSAAARYNSHGRITPTSEPRMPDLRDLKGIADKDRKLIEDAEALLGPEPTTMGFVKNLFWGHVREDLVFPYPRYDPDEKARCDELLARLDDYLENEHPSVQIDQEQQIP